MGPRIQKWDPCAGTGGIWQSEHDFRDKHASQFTTGRFVLLPKNLVTGVAKARIVKSRDLLRPRSSGTMKPRLSRGFFLAVSIWDQNLRLGPALAAMLLESRLRR
jgi:hypothetical protein